MTRLIVISMHQVNYTILICHFKDNIVILTNFYIITFLLKKYIYFKNHMFRRPNYEMREKYLYIFFVFTLNSRI